MEHYLRQAYLQIDPLRMGWTPAYYYFVGCGRARGNLPVSGKRLSHDDMSVFGGLEDLSKVVQGVGARVDH